MTIPRTPAAFSRLAALLAATVVVVVLLLSGLAVYQWGRASVGRDVERRSNEIASCRSSFRSDLIDGPIIDGLAAAGRGDKAGTAAAADAADRPEFDRLNVLSREDPGAFLDACEQRYG